MLTKLKYIALLILLIAIESTKLVSFVNADNDLQDHEQAQDVVIGSDGSIEFSTSNDEQQKVTTSEEDGMDSENEQIQQVIEEDSERTQIKEVNSPEDAENDQEQIISDDTIESELDEAASESERELNTQESVTDSAEAVVLQSDTNQQNQAESTSDIPSDIGSESGKESNDEPVDPNCPNRSHIIKCAGKYLDTDFDGKLSRRELDTVIERLPWYGRGILKLLGSTDKMMQKCDVDKDGYISMDYDMIHNADTCLATCFKRRAFKSSFFPDCEL